jgi:hypothetical protein
MTHDYVGVFIGASKILVATGFGALIACSPFIIFKLLGLI